MRVAVSTILVLGLAAAVPAVRAAPPAPAPSQNAGKAAIQFLPRAQRAPIPFELVGGIIIFKANVAGREVLVLLDNGWDLTTVDIALARAAGLNIDKPIGIARTPTGELKWQRVWDVPIVIPGQARIQTTIAAADLTNIAKAFGRKIEAVLGGDFFRSAAILVNSERRSFEFGQSGTLKMPATVPLVPISNAKPHIEMLVGGKSVLVALDLGAGGELTLIPEAWARVGPKDVEFSSRVTGHADGQPYITDFARVPEVRIGSLTLKDVNVAVRPWSANVEDGIVGMGFLANFNFALDIKAGKLWVMPRSALPIPHAWDPVFSLKQIAIAFPPGASQQEASMKVDELVRATQTMSDCDGAEAVATGLGAKIVTQDQMAPGDLPPALREMLEVMSVGQATRPFGSVQDGVKVLILCGRDVSSVGGPK